MMAVRVLCVILVMLVSPGFDHAYAGLVDFGYEVGEDGGVVRVNGVIVMRVRIDADEAETVYEALKTVQDLERIRPVMASDGSVVVLGDEGVVVSVCDRIAQMNTTTPWSLAGMWVNNIRRAAGYDEVLWPSEPVQAVMVDRGMASWYGPGFLGRLTASGEVYCGQELTAAHRSLPMGTMVRVTRTDNGKSVVVRINDRGPFVGGRVIDLSQRSAAVVGMIGAGVVPVMVAVVNK